MILKCFRRWPTSPQWPLRYSCGGRYTSLVDASHCKPHFNRMFLGPLSLFPAHRGFISSSRYQPKCIGRLYVTNEKRRIASRQVSEATKAASAPSHSPQTRTGSNVSSSNSYDADWSVRELYMVTCSEMWDDRPDGAQVVVGYIDTAASLDDSQRRGMSTALVLTSCLTDGDEMMAALQKLVDLGFRLIIPSMIGMFSLICYCSVRL